MALDSIDEETPAMPDSAKLLRHIRLLEERIASLESNNGADASQATPENIRQKPPGQPYTALRPIVRWCDFERYKNYFGDEDDDAAIDALQSNEQFNDEVRQELSRRVLAKEGKFDLALVPDLSTLGSEAPRVRSIRIKSKIVLRVLARVSAKHGMYHMAVDLPVIFTHPFDNLVFAHEEFKAEIDRLPVRGINKPETVPETDARQQRPGTPESPAAVAERAKATMASGSTNHGTMEDAAEQEVPMANIPGVSPRANGEQRVESVTPDEMELLQHYVNFMEEHIMPRYRQLAYGDASGDFSKKIHFDDLWWLFKPGDLIYSSPIMQVGKPRPSTEQRMWRLHQMSENHTQWNLDEIARDHSSSLGHKKEKPDEYQNDTAKKPDADHMTLWCYYLDYTGTNLCPVGSKIIIDRFAGEIDMTLLKAYPLRFAPHREEITKKLSAERSNFVRYSSTSPRPQVTHDGWSVAKNVEGWDVNYEDQHYEYIDSEVIIDFEESFQKHPWWKPNFFWSCIREQPATKWKLDGFPIMHWTGRQRSKVVSERQDLCQFESGLKAVRSNAWIAKDSHLVLTDYLSADLGSGIGRIYEYRETYIEPPKSPELTDEDILLLPIRLFAYSLRDRKFFQIDIRNLKEVKQVQDPFKSLQIDPAHKDTVESLLYTHFDRKTLDRRPGPAIPDQDLIRGKGRGVVILLHGAPGVGKTATAEAVAQKHGKPLFSISCGDLGYEPDRVESALTDIFRLAQVWDCILLLDEADVFLTQRFPNDLQRNAMVSMILRILEYYKGVLFLTTNRPGVLDEALKSRVHVSLHYPSLDLEKSKEIFRINLERLILIEERREEKSQETKLIIFEQEILDYAVTHYKRYGSTGLGSWNGRQIRNAFQVASSFARYDGTKVPGAQAQLRASHFEKVALMMYTYDEFRKQTLRKGDLEQAKSLGHRDDTYGIAPPRGPPDINIQGQQYGGIPGGMSNMHAPPPQVRQRGFSPYSPGQTMSGYPEYLSPANSRPGAPSQGPPHHEQAQGAYGGPSTFER